jgi:membrane-associated protease RseP (regulator of RpoE activity)
MDDFPDDAVPSAITDEDGSESKARTAAMLGLTYLNWIKTAAAGSRGVLVQRYGPPAALMACLFGFALLGWSNIQGRAPTLPSAEIHLSAQKTAEESPAQTAELEAMRAAQSLNTEEVSGPETVRPSLEAAKNEAGPGIVEAAGKTGRLPPKPVEKLANGGKRLDRIGLKIAALLAVDPVVDHSISAASIARKRGQSARGDAFDPSQHPNAPGAPRPLGITRTTARANKSSAEYAYGQPAN